MKIQLSDHFNYRRLLRFTLPSIIMMVFTSIYGVVDGLFVSNIVGSRALSSINIIMPLIMSIGAFGFMFGTGGSAVIAKTLGEGKEKLAKQYFTTLVLTIIVCGIILSAVCLIFIRPISYLLGASDLLIEDCVTYGTILVLGSVFFMLQTSFQTFFIIDERPKLGLLLTVIAGITNIILDFLFVYVFRWGIAGAAWATVTGYIIGGTVPIIYYFTPDNRILHFTKTKLYPRMLLDSCLNGSSEMVTNISMSFVTVLYNLQMMKLIGESGVAAYSAIMYVSFVFVAIFIGFSIGTAPIISFHYGAGNKHELKSLLRKSLVVISVISVTMVLLAQIFSSFIAAAFSGGDTALAIFTNKGFLLYSLSFFFTGFGIFGSAFFTALCNGVVSAILSFLRTLILPTLLILILPIFLGLDGVWLTVVAADCIASVNTFVFLLWKRKQYGYL